MVVLGAAACATEETGARVASPAPAIAGTTLDGAPFDLASLRGKPVIVNFWASWCTPCRDEFPLFKAKLAELGPTDGLVIMGVLYKDSVPTAQSFLDAFGMDWASLEDKDGAIAADYRVVAPPQTYFIDAEGVLRGIQIGEVREQDFSTQYAKIAP